MQYLTQSNEKIPNKNTETSETGIKLQKEDKCTRRETDFSLLHEIFATIYFAILRHTYFATLKFCDFAKLSKIS